ncbi:MAG TPA: nuclear transport factor 2 family protein [Bryobacteraceae bacterium]|nr:nuclear transport factor 2 family protein [Bryobacteraceae bacterium]
MNLLKYVYGRFNARDIDAVLAALDENVVWANGMEGGHVQGRDQVRSYWTRQWATMDPRVEPVAFTRGSQGEEIVEVHQIVHDIEGKLLLDRMVGHVFQIANGLITRFDIQDES